MLMHFPFLTTIIWLPIVGAIPILMCRDQHINKARWIGLLISVISLAVCILMIWKFDINSYHMQFREQVAWLPVLHINYDVGVDGISLPLVALTCFTTFIVVLASWTMVSYRVSQYLAAFMVMQGAVVGVFSSIDAILFYFFWEAMLIPMYLSIGIWGGPRRSYAAIKFFVYTFLGSALMLIALLYLGLHANSFSILDFYHLKMTLPVQIFVFLGFLLSFAIKVPMWPFHTWLPDAHTEAPTGGSVVLAALMLKLGAYGFLRFSLPITPDASHTLAWMMIVLSLISIIYIGFIAIAQTDMKKLIAYSSVSHMGFVMLGCFMALIIVSHTMNLKDAYMSMEGSMVQMISHAFGAGAMFLAFGVLYEQLHSRDIAAFGGVAKTMPIFAAFFMLFAMSNVGLPGTSGFVGEFMILLSTFQASFWVTFVAASILVIGAAYTLWMYKRVFFGAVTKETVANLKDVRGINVWMFVFLAIPVIWIGVDPNPLLNIFHASVGHLLELSIR
ncbi:MAG: NADH-quinone oxidoreductase subunit M [Gammaproteobacteria bacterium RIFCSPLOWO2_02_FULL_42_14]|nr:MAG: NADH-quinone oxidoreductase subunit M [Gammaproteobacteria bacterium RIFCSPHIGHO2_02_FULL_42_43]OGT27294.1 MAG: NADH-quinone oxidoreductase subunit M [Gammaproteobacteria bacterium RIFCSPHIGHO2_01_FULL_42_8]OGT52968.1 MAG: NADH-quinone oxidoreductase subunit M [Gammaproteobacteria bacterium RIFCSPHIGHO2_12_FULL_41_25]OGT61258.1 MAG: NADH-quinone oxidoreductase subunit M [Gammaproteobacteria bacterium RIFCSPLOWO2_02_FULL_42_14]OGT87187.1 MAG: NADH-quinone oxidoreductase subunit M [Gammap